MQSPKREKKVTKPEKVIAYEKNLSRQSSPSSLFRISTAKRAGCRQILISELEEPDFFSFDGERVFCFAGVKEVIGCGLVSIYYWSVKKRGIREKIVRETDKVYVLPVGRHYNNNETQNALNNNLH